MDLALMRWDDDEKLTARAWRQLLTLEHLDAGLTARATAMAVGGITVRLVGCDSGTSPAD